MDCHQISTTIILFMLDYRHEVLGVRLLALLPHLPLTHLGRVSFVGFVFQDFRMCISSQRFCVFAVLQFFFLFAFPRTMIGGLLPPALCPSSLSSMVAGSSGIVKLCKEGALENFFPPSFPSTDLHLKNACAHGGKKIGCKNVKNECTKKYSYA